MTVRRLVLLAAVSAALYAVADLGLSAAGRAPAWAAERAAPGEVVAAVVDWASVCARSLAASPDNCPQRGTDARAARSTPYAWSAGHPVVLHTRVAWLDALGAFEVRGTVNMNVRHMRVLADGRTQVFAGNFLAPFVVLVRLAADDRAMGAYRWTGGSRAAGFAIRYVGPWWAWQCPLAPPGGRGDEEDPAR